MVRGGARDVAWDVPRDVLRGGAWDVVLGGARDVARGVPRDVLCIFVFAFGAPMKYRCESVEVILM